VVGGEQAPHEPAGYDDGGGSTGCQHEEHHHGLHEYSLHGGDTGEDQAGHRAGQEHQSGGLGALDLRRQRGAQRVRKVCRVSGGLSSRSSSTRRRATSTIAVIKLPTTFRRWARVCVLQRKDVEANSAPR
jgi:hypothetical protein